jgi:hypothetical protein
VYASTHPPTPCFTKYLPPGKQNHCTVPELQLYPSTLITANQMRFMPGKFIVENGQTLQKFNLLLFVSIKRKVIIVYIIKVIRIPQSVTFFLDRCFFNNVVYSTMRLSALLILHLIPSIYLIKTTIVCLMKKLLLLVHKKCPSVHGYTLMKDCFSILHKCSHSSQIYLKKSKF